MFSPTSTAIFRFVGWSFLPSALANGSITLYHRLLKPGSAPPRVGTSAYLLQYRIAFTLLAAAYLIYTVVAGITSLPPNYYRILGVDRTADEQGLKTAFRAFARRNHPDRPEIGLGGEERFREVREAYEMLKNPVRRFAYERFGPDIITWKDCTTTREYLRRGVISSTGFHLISAASLAGMSLFGKATASSFWRYVILLTVLVSEAYLVFSPTTPILSAEAATLPPPSFYHSVPLLSWLLPYQQVNVLHQLFVSLSICVSQLAPVLFPNVGRDDKDVLKAVSEVIQRIAGLGGAAEHEVNRMIQSELRALRGVRPTLSASNSFTAASNTSSAVTTADDATIDILASEMENLLIDARLRSHPVLGAMWERVAEEAREALLATSTSPPAGGPVPREYSTPSQTPRSNKSRTPGAASRASTPKADPLPSSNIVVTSASPLEPHATLPPLEVDTSNLIIEADRSEAESATTLHDRRSRSRSASPFAFVGAMSGTPLRGRTPVANLADSELTAFEDGSWKSVRSPSPTKSAGGLPGTQHTRSLGRASGKKVDGVGKASSGARFFPSAFSSARD